MKKRKTIDSFLNQKSIHRQVRSILHTSASQEQYHNELTKPAPGNFNSWSAPGRSTPSPSVMSFSSPFPVLRPWLPSPFPVLCLAPRCRVVAEDGAVVCGGAGIYLCCGDTVGGDVGNVGWSSNLNYTVWAEGKHFYNGDWLFFVFHRNQMNVLEVNQTDYESCHSDHFLHNFTTGAGRDVVPLNVTRKYYFYQW